MDIERKKNISFILEKKIPKELIVNIINNYKEIILSRTYHICNYRRYLKPNLILLNQIKYINKWKLLFNK